MMVLRGSLRFTCSGPDESQVARAKILTDDLLTVVRSEHAKATAVLYQQQAELHMAQSQFGYTGYGVSNTE